MNFIQLDRRIILQNRTIRRVFAERPVLFQRSKIAGFISARTS